MTRMKGAIALLVATVAMGLVASPPVSATKSQPRSGDLLEVQPLPRTLWIPGSARAAKLVYVTTNTFDRPDRSTGTVFIPRGKAPRGGWPVISWAHGTSGLADKCAPSNMGPSASARDRAYLANWLKQGYAIVASDYTGLGTRGLHAYLDGRSTAHNVVDMVKAARSYDNRLPKRSRLARTWVAIGQSQGGGAAIYTARYATAFGGRELDYRGAVGTGTPAYVEDIVQNAGPKSPPAPLTPALTAYFSYLMAALRYAEPDLGIDDILTPTGKKYLRLAERMCTSEFYQEVEGVVIGDFFTQPLLTLPNFRETLVEYLGMPEAGFDKPFFLGHGAQDVDVPYAVTSRYASVLQANRQPVTFKTYPSDHGGTLTMSQADTIPYVRKLFASVR